MFVRVVHWKTAFQPFEPISGGGILSVHLRKSTIEMIIFPRSACLDAIVVASAGLVQQIDLLVFDGTTLMDSGILSGSFGAEQ